MILHIYNPLTNVPTKCQLPTPYRFRDIAWTRFSNSRSLQQGQMSFQGHTMTLHTYNPNQCPYQVSTSYTLQVLRYRPDKVSHCPPGCSCGHSIMYSTSKAIFNSCNIVSIKCESVKCENICRKAELQGQISACLQRTYICIIYTGTSHRMI